MYSVGRRAFRSGCDPQEEEIGFHDSWRPPGHFWRCFCAAVNADV
jgi:hypothetical protein